jgi:hypothetical protein
MTDGTSCDDGNACTEKDQCTAGACKGTARKSSPTVLGTVRSFGSGPALETVVAFPSQDRAVFLTGNLLTLVKIDGDRMEVLDRLLWGSHATAFQVSATIWVFRPGTFIVPLSSQRIAVIGSDWSIDLFDIGQDRLQSSYRFGFSAGSQEMIEAVVAQGNNLWTCIGNWVQRYEIDDVHGVIKQDTGFTLPASHSCYGLALSPDQTSLLAATSSGLDVIDISTNDGKGTLQKTVLSGTFLLDVLSNRQMLGVYRLEGTTSGLGSILTLNATDYTSLATYTSAGSTMPVGFAMLAGGLLLEQWNEESCRVVDAGLYPLGTATTPPISDFVTMSACSGQFGLPPAVLASAGQLVDLPPNHQIARVDATTGKLTPLGGTEQGSYARVLPAGPNLVEVHGPASMQLIDISQPDTPAVRQGGLLVPMNADWLRIEISTDGQATMLTVPDSELPRAGSRTSLYWRNDGSLPTVAGSLSNDDPKAQWAAAGQFLYEVSPSSSSDFRLRRFPVSGFTRDENQTPSPDVDQILSSAAPATLDQRKGEIVAADAMSGDVLIAEVRAGSLANGTLLSWYTKDTTGYRAAFARLPDDGAALDLAVFGGRTALIFDNHVLLVDRSGQTLATYTHPTGDLQRLLSFDDKYLYVAATFQDATSKITNGVLVLNTADLSTSAQFTLPEPVLSTALVGSSRVFGMQSTLAVASTVCSGN